MTTTPSDDVDSETARYPSRNKIVRIAADELGVREATGNNDGKRVEAYLRYTNLGKGYAWCAAVRRETR